MPDPSTLFLLTNVYPLSKGEEFIENEIDHLARSFERVIVVATQTRPTDTVTRPVPANVEVITAGLPRPTGCALALGVANGLRQLPASALSKVSVRHPQTIAIDALFEARSRTSADELLSKLPQLHLEPNSHAVIYSFWFHTPARVGMLLAQDLRSRGVVVDRFVSRAHRYDLYEEFAPYHHIPERRMLLEALDAVCPVSDQGTRALQSEWPEYRAKVQTRRLGTVDPGQVIDCSREPFRIVSCSHLQPVKQMTRMPAVLARLRSRGVDARWTHLGDGPDMPLVRAAATDCDVTDYVDLRGYVPNTEVISVQRQLRPSCLINLSESEGLPVSMMESASLGIPIVATDVGGVSEIVHDGHDGRLIPADFTDDQAADALQWLATLPADRYEQVCGASRRVWQTDFDQAVVYPRFCSEVLRGASSPSLAA